LNLRASSCVLITDKIVTKIARRPMRNPAEYLEEHVFEARRPWRELQPVVAYADAVKAIEIALADAEKYKYLLMRALRRHTNETSTATIPMGGQEAAVLPLYPNVAA